MAKTHNTSNNQTPSVWQKLLKSPKAIVSIILITIVIIVFIYSVIVVIIRHNKVAVTVTVAPYTAKLTLNGTNIRNNHKIYLERGHYHLVAENENIQ